MLERIVFGRLVRSFMRNIARYVFFERLKLLFKFFNLLISLENCFVFNLVRFEQFFLFKSDGILKFRYVEDLIVFFRLDKSLYILDCDNCFLFLVVVSNDRVVLLRQLFFRCFLQYLLLLLMKMLVFIKVCVIFVLGMIIR